MASEPRRGPVSVGSTILSDWSLSPGQVILALFVASAIYVHFRGQVRLDFSRRISDHSTFMAPINCFLYLFSAVPNKPFLEVVRFPELKVPRDNWQTIRDEAAQLYEAGHIKGSERYDDVAFNSFIKKGRKRFYVKWYEDTLPSAHTLCPKTVALLDLDKRRGGCHARSTVIALAMKFNPFASVAAITVVLVGLLPIGPAKAEIQLLELGGLNTIVGNTTLDGLNVGDGVFPGGLFIDNDSVLTIEKMSSNGKLIVGGGNKASGFVNIRLLLFGRDLSVR